MRLPQRCSSMRRRCAAHATGLSRRPARGLCTDGVCCCCCCVVLAPFSAPSLGARLLLADGGLCRGGALGGPKWVMYFSNAVRRVFVALRAFWVPSLGSGSSGRCWGWGWVSCEALWAGSSIGCEALGASCSHGAASAAWSGCCVRRDPRARGGGPWRPSRCGWPARRRARGRRG